MTSIDKKQQEIINLELRIAAIHDQMDELEQLSHHLTSKILQSKRQLELITNRQEELNV